MTDLINHPSHYEINRYTCEPADLSVMLPHPFASAVEYMIRAPYKGTEAQDYRKAAWWLKKALQTPEFWSEEGLALIHRYGFKPTQFIAAAYAMGTKSQLILDLFTSNADCVCISKSNVEEMICRLEKRADALENPKEEDEDED